MRPHSWFCRFVSFALAVLVLIFSVGFTVQRMTCRISERSRVAVSVAVPKAARGCTARDNAEPGKLRDGCCDFSQQVHKLAPPVPGTAAKVLVPAPLLAILPQACSWPAASVPTPAVAGGARWFAADSSPPPLGGRALLARVCTLVV